LEILVADPHKAHSATELDRIAARRGVFEEQVCRILHRWGAQAQAYCWLPSAALMIVRISQAPLEGIMRSLHRAFSGYLHQVGIAGHPYSVRYRALLLDPDELLLDFARHIFQAPLVERMCSNPLYYAHSSVLACFSRSPAPLVAHSELSRALARRGFSTVQGLERFLTERPTTGFPALLRHGSSQDCRIAGGPSFVRNTRQKSRQAALIGEHDPVLEWVIDLVRVRLAPANGGASYEQALARALTAWLVSCSGVASLSQVARWFHCGKSTLHRGIERYSKIRPECFCEATLASFSEFLEKCLRSTGELVGGAEESQQEGTDSQQHRVGHASL
jgi:hypothetical protein